jgi:polyferredoxin
VLKAVATALLEQSELLERLVANIKFVDKAFSGMQGSYVELLTVLAIGLLGVLPGIVPEKRRQLYRHLTQLFGVVIFIFVVYTCLGVFGMVRNFQRGMNEIGRENIVALYYCSVPVMVLVTSLIFGPMFCGWICPTGALQELAGLVFARRRCRQKRDGYPFSWLQLLLAAFALVVFVAWMFWLSVTRIFFVEDASIYWSEVLILLEVVLVWKMREWDGPLRRLRQVSFAVVVLASIAGLRITSPVHFGFNKVYDPASILATVIVVLASLGVSRVWCRYLCPWREAIAWAARQSVRRLETDSSKCCGCGKCDEVCGVDAVHHGQVDPRECHMCLRCVDHCPGKAIKLKDEWSPMR